MLYNKKKRNSFMIPTLYHGKKNVN